MGLRSVPSANTAAWPHVCTRLPRRHAPAPSLQSPRSPHRPCSRPYSSTGSGLPPGPPCGTLHTPVHGARTSHVTRYGDRGLLFPLRDALETHPETIAVTRDWGPPGGCRAERRHQAREQEKEGFSPQQGRRAPGRPPEATTTPRGRGCEPRGSESPGPCADGTQRGSGQKASEGDRAQGRVTRPARDGAGGLAPAGPGPEGSQGLDAARLVQDPSSLRNQPWGSCPSHCPSCDEVLSCLTWLLVLLCSCGTAGGLK